MQPPTRVIPRGAIAPLEKYRPPPLEHGRARHDWRTAGLPVDLLAEPGRQEWTGFTDAERAMGQPIACRADHHLIADRPP
jgi:hypothetical protein